MQESLVLLRLGLCLVGGEVKECALQDLNGLHSANFTLKKLQYKR